MEEKSNFTSLSIVAIVAIVALVMIVQNPFASTVSPSGVQDSYDYSSIADNSASDTTGQASRFNLTQNKKLACQRVTITYASLFDPVIVQDASPMIATENAIKKLMSNIASTAPADIIRKVFIGSTRRCSLPPNPYTCTRTLSMPLTTVSATCIFQIIGAPTTSTISKLELIDVYPAQYDYYCGGSVNLVYDGAIFTAEAFVNADIQYACN